MSTNRKRKGGKDGDDETGWGGALASPHARLRVIRKAVKKVARKARAMKKAVKKAVKKAKVARRRAKR